MLHRPITPSDGRGPAQVQRRLHGEEIRQLRAARQQGITVDVLARRFGVHRTTVMAHLHRNAAEYPGVMARPVPANSAAPVDLVDDGLTEAEIAERVARWLDELEKEPTVTLPVSAAQELEAARRDDDL